jgi:hypothetical protein
MCTGFSRVDSMTDELVYRKRKDTLCFPQCGPYENENRQRMSVTFNRLKKSLSDRRHSLAIEYKIPEQEYF